MESKLNLNVLHALEEKLGGDWDLFSNMIGTRRASIIDGYKKTQWSAQLIHQLHLRLLNVGDRVSV